MYKFIKEIDSDNEFDNVEVSFKVNALTHVELTETFNYFLKACGFKFKGQVVLVRSDDEEY